MIMEQWFLLRNGTKDPIRETGIFPSWRTPEGGSRRKNRSMKPPSFGGRRPGGTPGRPGPTGQILRPDRGNSRDRV